MEIRLEQYLSIWLDWHLSRASKIPKREIAQGKKSTHFSSQNSRAGLIFVCKCKFFIARKEQTERSPGNDACEAQR